MTASKDQVEVEAKVEIKTTWSGNWKLGTFEARAGSNSPNITVQFWSDDGERCQTLVLNSFENLRQLGDLIQKTINDIFEIEKHAKKV